MIFSSVGTEKLQSSDCLLFFVGFCYFLSHERILILKYSHFLLEYRFSVLTSNWVCSNIVFSLIPVTTIKCIDSNLET